jgi:branched-chain amino acid transport system ATP-binding protein
MKLLELIGINTFYGISHILFDVSLEIHGGEVVCLLGRNGVGKTTTLRSIMGLTPPRSGRVIFDGLEIKGPPFKIARMGLGFVPEDRIIFPDLTVRENLELGFKKGYRRNRSFERVYEMFPRLKERESQLGGTLSGGEQQMLTIARTLIGEPRLLLLDEPSEGLAPNIAKDLGKQLHSLKNQGITILLCEQSASFAMRLSDRAYFLEKGQIRWNGDLTELRNKPEILKAYLGI